MFRERPSRGLLKWRQVIEFGPQGFPRGRVYRASRAAYRVFCSRNGFPGRYAHAGRRGKPRRFDVRVTSSGISRHECRGNGECSPVWGTPRERALVGMCRVTSWLHVSPVGREERASRKPPPWRCRGKKKRASLQVYGPAGCGGHPVNWAKEALVSRMG